MSKVMSNHSLFESILSSADIKLNGNRSWDLIINDESIYEKILTGGSLAFGEAYMDGLWECEDIAEMISRLLSSDVESMLGSLQKISLGLKVGAGKLKKAFNLQSIERAKRDVSYHYDIGNELYSYMLDKRMTYTCAYWKDSDNLDDAQEAKLDLLCRKLGLKKGMRVLDIGCGWGSFMVYAAQNYGVICDGLTLSQEQANYGKELIKNQELPINFILEDYREYVPELKYDRIVSVGMLEHVGPDNYREYFEKSYDMLADNGVFLVHTIGSPTSSNKTDPWIDKYIFPNGVIPSISQIGNGINGLYNIEDLHNIGPDYDKTLCSWHENFEKNWEFLNSTYDERFYRMWRYYLLSCAAAFRSRNLNLWQFSLTKVGTQKPEYVRAV
ncbi:cyclopropane fatty acyl phospholipid synthase [Marinomonas arenicola]|uniref:cyclopropane fatty acyl phospholipid synthase n=1 Tax=Marinomonas TaxID=28253 RepID=UPI001056A838|nr:cyclopropane fatty acyl phospholipid synthase [Marinomonas sp. KMM3893]